MKNRDAGRGPQNSRPRSSAPRSDYLSDTRYESEALATEDRGTETGKIKGVTRDKNCGVDKHPLFSLASPVPVIFRRPSFVSAPLCFPPRAFLRPVRKRASRVLARASQPGELALIPGSPRSSEFPRAKFAIDISEWHIYRMTTRRGCRDAGKCAEGSWIQRRSIAASW